MKSSQNTCLSFPDWLAQAKITEEFKNTRYHQLIFPNKINTKMLLSVKFTFSTNFGL